MAIVILVGVHRYAEHDITKVIELLSNSCYHVLRALYGRSQTLEGVGHCYVTKAITPMSFSSRPAAEMSGPRLPIESMMLGVH